MSKVSGTGLKYIPDTILTTFHSGSKVLTWGLTIIRQNFFLLYWHNRPLKNWVFRARGGGGIPQCLYEILAGTWEFRLSSDFRLFCSSQNPIFRLLMQFECNEKHIFAGISDYFRLFLTDTLFTKPHFQTFNALWMQWKAYFQAFQTFSHRHSHMPV